MTINTIMIFAAGKGTRMAPITDEIPKPLVLFENKPLLYHTLELALTYSFKRIIVNCHHLYNQIQDAIKIFIDKYRPKTEIIVIHEKELLETGGGIKNAFNYFSNQDAIFSCNSDVVIKSINNPFEELINFWNPNKMDFLLLMNHLDNVVSTVKKGDFSILDDGKLINNDNKDYMFTGLQILKPKIIYNNPQKIFSLSKYFKDSYRLYGVKNKGTFYHISTQSDLSS